MKSFCLVAAVFAAAIAGTGCVSHVRVRSEPAGAMIRYRGEGRAAFRWKTAPGAAPTAFDVYYGRISTYAIWPDGTQSPHKTVTLSNWRDPEEIVLRPATPPPRPSPGR